MLTHPAAGMELALNFPPGTAESTQEKEIFLGAEEDKSPQAEGEWEDTLPTELLLSVLLLVHPEPPGTSRGISCPTQGISEAPEGAEKGWTGNFSPGDADAHPGLCSFSLLRSHIWDFGAASPNLVGFFTFHFTHSHVTAAFPGGFSIIKPPPWDFFLLPQI